jgi:sugar lactone lactonase YvrE
MQTILTASKSAPQRALRLSHRLFLMVLGVGLAALAVIIALPSPTDAVAWQPPTVPAQTGVLSRNGILDGAVLVGQGVLEEPEDIAIDDLGNLYTGTREGTIWRITVDESGGTVIIPFANTGGNPLGLRFDNRRNLIVADAQRGLLSIDKQGNVIVLATEAGGVPFHFTNDLDIAANGTIYFSDASTKFDNSGANPVRDTMEGRPHGRLLAYYPDTGTTEVLLTDLYFANGVTLTQAEDAVLVAELARYRITRYWLKGERKGTSDTLIDNLPGLPDGIMSDRAGTIWVSIGSPRSNALDTMHQYPFLINLMSKLPDSLLLAVTGGENYGMVLAVNENGEVIQALYDSQGVFSGGISNVVPYEGRLYLGTRYGPGQIGIVTLRQ